MHDEPDYFDPHERWGAVLERADRQLAEPRVPPRRLWEPPPQPAPVKPEPDLYKLVEEINKHTESRIDAFADIVGSELGLREKAIRNDAANQQATVRKEIGEVRTEVHLVEDRLRTELRNSMAGAANRLLQLREEREATQHDLQKQILTLQRELFDLRQVLANERSLGPGKGNGAMLTYDHHQ